MVVLVTGGARSGKSAFAERFAALEADKGTYIATAQALDGEMEGRIARHRRQRESAGFAWETIEEPLDLAGAFLRSEQAPVVLVDCLTLWLTNVLLEREDGEKEAYDRILPRIEQLQAVLASYKGRAILVTNEVGDGIVPSYPLGRVYRDLAGILNQRVASVSDEVYLVTAGIPVELKRLAYRWPDGQA